MTWKHNLRAPISSVLLLHLRRRQPLLLLPSSATSPSPPVSSSTRGTPRFLGNSSKLLGFRYICSSADSSLRCWNCGSLPHTTPFLVCDSCRTVQPLDSSVDYFQIFKLEKKYDIEEKNLEGKYKEWQKKLHPDLVHSKSEREREYAAEQSARVIDAYHTLTSPLSRAIYVACNSQLELRVYLLFQLKLEGVDVDEEHTVSDPEMLAEILEIREAVEEAPDSQALNKIQTQAQEKLNQWSDSFANAFQSKKYEDARTSIQRMTYYKRVNEEIVKKL